MSPTLTIQYINQMHDSMISVECRHCKRRGSFYPRDLPEKYQTWLLKRVLKRAKCTGCGRIGGHLSQKIYDHASRASIVVQP